MSVEYTATKEFEISFPIVIIGGGACGLCAALAARDAGQDVLILERDKSLLGTTAMSTGLIPAAGSIDQAERGVDDSPSRFAADIMAKTKGRADEVSVLKLAEESVDTIEWLRGDHDVGLTLLDGFLYPGHSAMRMYGMPNRSGSELMGALTTAADTAGVDILTESLVKDLIATKDGKILGVRIERPDGALEEIGCQSLILACCGFAGEADLVSKYIPEITKAVFHGHSGNKGEAILWGEELGAQLDDMSAYQGHAGLAAGHGIPILWPLIMEGGFQINIEGQRFADESKGYSEQAVNVLNQPKSVAWSIFDERLHQLMIKFDDYQDALRAGAVLSADSLAELSVLTDIPLDNLHMTFAEVEACVKGEQNDRYGRDFIGKPSLVPPYRAARVTGALFHTQGGLRVDENARVVRTDGRLFPNLFAGGGAARGISGPGADGYIAGNGLLTATTYGKLAGRAAAQVVSQD